MGPGLLGAVVNTPIRPFSRTNLLLVGRTDRRHRKRAAAASAVLLKQPTMLSLFVTGAIVTASAAYTVSCVRAARREVAAKALRIKDALEWLAWRDPRLRDYDGPGDQVVPVAVDALVVHGCSMVAVPQRAADLFVDVLHPAGCNVVVLTGGVGRETPPLWRELAEREMYLIFERSWGSEAPPPHVALPTQGVGSKPVLDGFDLTMPPEKLREFCSEADLFLEIFSARCKERGLLLTFGGNPMRDGGAAAPGRHAKPTIYVETASTHTGTNVEYTQRTLELLGFGKQPNVCVVQQPQVN